MKTNPPITPVTPDEVSLLRDSAVLHERDNFELAHKLMVMAQRFRPDGPFINAKLQEYRARVEEGNHKVQKMVQSGALAIVPVGFRCYTRKKIAQSLGLTQPSLPFDSGFFPPTSIARLLKTRQVAMQFPDPNETTHQVCTKHENQRRDDRHGIDFRTSSYEEINSLAKDRNQPKINNLLDATFGYYTLDKANGFVLAHFNWHQFADEEISKGVRQPELNIPNINKILNSRIKRMFDMCDHAHTILFVVDRPPSCEFMAIDDDVYDITDIEPIRDAVAQIFGERAIVAEFQEIDTENKLFKLIAREHPEHII